jgi:hypothetical protein
MAVPKKQPSKASKASKVKPLPLEEAFPAWFSQFAEEGEPDKIGGEGIEKLFDDMELSMEGVSRYLTLRWRVWPLTSDSLSARPTLSSSRTGSEPPLEPLVRSRAQIFSVLSSPSSASSSPCLASSCDPLTLASPSRSIASSPALSNWLAKAHDEIMGSADQYEFRRFYSFVFPFLKNEGAKTIPGEMAVAMWGTVLAPRYPLAESFVEYATVSSPTPVSTWRRLLRASG